jgi:hypothetical protein
MNGSSSSLSVIGVPVWTIVYNVILFVLACVLLVGAKRYPQYNIGIYATIVGLFVVNLQSILRFYWRERELVTLQKAQNSNIVPSHCPDYWSKVTTSNAVTCSNAFVQSSYDTDDSIIRFGGSNAPNSYTLQQMTNLTNQQKCWNVSQANIPWIDLQNKCSAAGI